MKNCIVCDKRLSWEGSQTYICGECIPSENVKAVRKLIRKLCNPLPKNWIPDGIAMKKVPRGKLASHPLFGLSTRNWSEYAL